MNANMLTDLDLMEVSLVTNGANQGAKLSLVKHYEEDNTKMEELTKQIQDLTDANAELVKSLEEAKATIELSKEVEPINKEDIEDPRILKALEDGEAASKATEAVRKEFEEFKAVQLTKEIETQVADYSVIFKSEDEQKEATDILKSVAPEVRSFFLDNLAKSVKVLDEASKTIEKEIGANGDEDVSILDRVQKSAESMLEKGEAKSIHDARAKIVAKLSDEERNEYNKGDK